MHPYIEPVVYAHLIMEKIVYATRWLMVFLQSRDGKQDFLIWFTNGRSPVFGKVLYCQRICSYIFWEMLKYTIYYYYC